MYCGGFNNGGVDWDYFDNENFSKLTEKYMLPTGEGETKASQIVTAINKLIYKWYNDGDVFDNTHNMSGWCNDLSSYANWLYKYTIPDVKIVLDRIENIWTMPEYELILKDLADLLMQEDVLKSFEVEKEDSIYSCEGKFIFDKDAWN